MLLEVGMTNEEFVDLKKVYSRAVVLSKSVQLKRVRLRDPSESGLVVGREIQYKKVHVPIDYLVLAIKFEQFQTF
jgi:hypothetical protein